MHNFLDYLSHELIAAEILLAGIYKLFKRGQVNTHPLGELTRSGFLMEIDPNDTKLKGIVYMQTEQAVKFVSDVVKKVPIADRIIESIDSVQNPCNDYAIGNIDKYVTNKKSKIIHSISRRNSSLLIIDLLLPNSAIREKSKPSGNKASNRLTRLSPT